MVMSHDYLDNVVVLTHPPSMGREKDESFMRSISQYYLFEVPIKNNHPEVERQG
jgi:hypothetical protein